MKVGVITFHNAHNYGATLQTWALQRALAGALLAGGERIEPCVVHYHPFSIDRTYLLTRRTGLLGLIKKATLLVKKKDRLRLTRFNRYSSFIKSNLVLLGDYTDNAELERADIKLDAYITGSDQVWNFKLTDGYDPAYFLEFVKDGAKKISYAASTGGDRIERQYAEDFVKNLRTFTAVSVREPSLGAQLAKLAKIEAVDVVDPTLLLNRQDYDAIKKQTYWKEPYILVYSIQRNKKFKKFVNKLSKEMGLPVIQRKMTKQYINELGKFWTHTPGEFLGDIEGAEFVLTNSFHGTVFSIIYEKPFLSMLHTVTGARTAQLLERLGLESHIVSGLKDFHDPDLMYVNDWGAVKARLSDQREKSFEFLRKALS
jgi:hypothetical protein